MHKLSKALFAALLATILLAIVVAPAAARRFMFTEQHLRIVWPTESKFRAGIGGPRCLVTLEGSLHSRTISKVAGALVGFITAAVANQPSCEGGSIRFLNGTETMFNTLPWHWRYAGFTGSLPNITGVQMVIIGASFRVGTCLYRSIEAFPMVVIFELNGVGGVTALRIEEASRIRRNEEGEITCAQFIPLEGRGIVTVLEETSAIAVRLVN